MVTTIAAVVAVLAAAIAAPKLRPHRSTVLEERRALRNKVIAAAINRATFGPASPGGRE